jgi:outer membrane protein assembly factor BamB
MGRRAARLMGAVGLVALVVAAAGCWPAPGQGPDRRAYNAGETAITVATVGDLATVWRATLAPPGGSGGPVRAPVVGAGGVFASSGIHLFGVDPATGAVRWRYPGEQFFDAGDPFVVGGRVLYSWTGTMGFGGAPIGSGTWLDPVTGAELEHVAGYEVQALRGGNRIDTYTQAPELILFARHHEVTDGATGDTWGTLVTIDGVARPATAGAERWYRAGSTMDPADPANEAPGVQAYPYAEPEVCSDHELVTVHCSLWTTPTAGMPVASPVIGPGERSLFVATDDGAFHALDPATGAVQWTAPLGGTPTAAPAVDADTAFVPLADGRLVALAAGGCGAATCATTWSATTAGGGRGLQPAVAGGVVYVATSAGAIAGFDADGCRRRGGGARSCPALWSDDLGAAATGPPAVSGGRLYVGTAAGELVAYAPA